MISSFGSGDPSNDVPWFQVHTMDRVFQCPQCDKGFKEVRTLRLHLKIHNAEYPEQCNVCQKVFRTKWQLKQHQVSRVVYRSKDRGLALWEKNEPVDYRSNVAQYIEMRRNSQIETKPYNLKRVQNINTLVW